MEFVKGNPNINARLEIPVYNRTDWNANSSLPPNGEFDDMAICWKNGIYEYREKTDGVLVTSFDSDGLWYSETNGETWYQSNVTTGSWIVFRGPDKWVAGSPNSSQGLWYSTNGKTWTVSNIASYSATTFAYGNGKYVVRYSSNIATSTDGVTWSGVSGVSSAFDIINFANGVFIACSISSSADYKGLWRSTDGTTWTRIISDKRIKNSYFANGVWIAFVYNETSGKCIYRSTDNGQTWTNLGPDAIQDRCFYWALYKDGIWLAATRWGGLGVWRSTDNGLTWTQRSISTNITSLVTNGDIIVAGASSGAPFYSEDLGYTWTRGTMASGSTGAGNSLGIVWAGTQFISISDSTNKGIYKSRDGKTWSNTYKTTGSVVAEYLQRMQFNPNNIMVIGTTSGLWYSEDNGLTWKVSNISTNQWIVYRGPDKWIAISTDGSVGIKYSLDGKTWNNTNSGASNGYSITYGNGKYVARFSNGAASSYNGITWTYNAFASVRNIIFVKDTFYACDRETNTNKGIWKSTDGVTWTQIYSARKVENIAYGEGVFLAFVYNETDGKCILRSTDNGSTWTEVGPAAAESRNFRYAFYKDGVWLAAIVSGYIGLYRSTDNGQTWGQCYGSGNYSSEFCYHNGRLLIAGSFNNAGTNQNCILYSDDLGATWNIANTTSEFRGIIWAGDKYIAGSSGSGCHISYDGVYWYNPDGSTFTVVGYPSNNMFYQDGYWEKLIGLYGDSNGIIGEIKPSINTIQDSRWLLCDGSTYDTTKYSELYAILGTNKLPDLRELIPVGAGTNAGAVTTQGSASTFPTGHDVFAKGEIKERQIQNHSHATTVANHTHNFTLSSSNPNWAHEHTYYHTESQAQGSSSKDGNEIIRITSVEPNYNTNTAGYWDNTEDDIILGPNWTNGSPKTSTDDSGKVFAVVSYGVNFYIRASSTYKA